MKLEAIGATFALLSEFSVFLRLFRLIFVFIVTISRRIVQGICYEMRFFSPPRTVHIANVIIAVAIFSIPAFARLVRGNTLVLKQQTFIESARSIGASDMTILLRHILPGTVSSIVVFFTMRIGTSIISAASLSFLGLGAQPPTPEWGAMLNEARADMVIAPHVAIFPALLFF